MNMYIMVNAPTEPIRDDSGEVYQKKTFPVQLFLSLKKMKRILFFLILIDNALNYSK